MRSSCVRGLLRLVFDTGALRMLSSQGSLREWMCQASRRARRASRPVPPWSRAGTPFTVAAGFLPDRACPETRHGREFFRFLQSPESKFRSHMNDNEAAACIVASVILNYSTGALDRSTGALDH